jgi:hypothetical protein
VDLLKFLNSNEFRAAFCGAVVGGIFAVLAQFLSTLWQRKTEQNAERRAVDSTLRAILAELKVIKAYFLDRLDWELETQQKKREAARKNRASQPQPIAMIRWRILIVRR